ncbi:hypothetical protein B0I12_002541 [Microbacterium hydrothermale]|uniref:hypothetical protein n=1 Tax=Microbacterium hydrothermale TaxID=857427 RepID=UPI002225D90D|nr:hypothetical protein [Microbacterium hydrothermale]MCW2165386.1 hypothetical protein [Microbacterium hydrothermale]
MTIDIEEAKQVHAELAALHKEGWCACQSSTLPARVEATLGDLIAALSTPPADDVREALIGILSYNSGDEVEAVRRILNRFEVRPRGTVTDAEALAKAWDEGVRTAGAYGHEDTWTHEMTPYSENPYRGEARS